MNTKPLSKNISQEDLLRYGVENDLFETYKVSRNISLIVLIIGVVFVSGFICCLQYIWSILDSHKKLNFFCYLRTNPAFISSNYVHSYC